MHGRCHVWPRLTPRPCLWLTDQKHTKGSTERFLYGQNETECKFSRESSSSKPRTISSHHLSLNREGRWGTTDDFATSFLHFSLFSIALLDLANSRPVHSLMLSSHPFLCLPSLLSPFTVPCKMVLVRPDERKTGPYRCSLRLFTMARRSSCGPIAC